MSHTLLISSELHIPSPHRAVQGERPGIVQRLTMEGKGCRREVPGLTLALFLGQKKASSGSAAAMLEKNEAVEPVRVGWSWGVRGGGGACCSLAWEPGPIHKRLLEST